MRVEMVGIRMMMVTMQETLMIQQGEYNWRGHVFC